MSLKVGILSMQRIINYGSFLQAYALKRVLEELGAECYFIDIKSGEQLPGNEIESRTVSFLKRIIRVSVNLVANMHQTLNNFMYSRRLKRKFINQYYDILKLSHSFVGCYDLVVIGSDEVFNCCEKSKWGYSSQLFGSGINADKKISYAASFGSTTIDKIAKFNLAEDLSRSLKNLNSISVRDKNSSDIITELTGIKPLMHLDPVFIYDFSNEINKCNIKIKDYIVIYTYPGRVKDRSEIQAICSFAKKLNKKLVSIYCWYTWCDEILIPDTPFEVLAYFKSADYIITDTFHGTIFSIINEKKFGTIIRDSNRQKLTSLLNNLSLKDRIIDNVTNLDNILKSSISYGAANINIKNEKNRSIEFLKMHLRNR
jgi:polysaccharide pyruvyl transferase WcaK-like protein